MGYKTDLTDEQWALICDEFPRSTEGRPRKWADRQVVNAILYVLKTGCQWYLLPKDFPPKSTVHRLFVEWQYAGVWERINLRLVAMAREEVGRNAAPTAAVIDAQTVKSALKGGSSTGISSGTMRARTPGAASAIAA